MIREIEGKHDNGMRNSRYDDQIALAIRWKMRSQSREHVTSRLLNASRCESLLSVAYYSETSHKIYGFECCKRRLLVATRHVSSHCGRVIF